jgi:RNA polymerase sigma-70 factor
MCTFERRDATRFDELACIMYTKGLEAHGSLGIAAEQLIARLREITGRHLPEDASEAARCDFVIRLYSTDLYLTTACSIRSESAWARFYKLYDTYLKQCLRRVCHEQQILNDLLDSPATELFLPDGSGRSRISSYDGRASLRTWLRVIIANRVVNELEKKSNSLRSAEWPVEHAAARPRFDEVLDARRLEPLLQQCLVRACLTLTSRERWIILSRYEERLQLGCIARTHGIHQSTVTRILERSIAKFREAITQTLHEACNDQFKFDSIGYMLLNGELDSISLLAYLKAPGADASLSPQSQRLKYAQKRPAATA